MSPTDTPDDDLTTACPPLSPEEEATMQAEIELALEPYRKIAPASLIPVLREKLEHALRTHPYPRQLLKAFAKRKPVIVSGEGASTARSRTSGEKAGGKEGA